MSLDALPNPSLNLAAICKLDLCNNNLQVNQFIETPMDENPFGVYHSSKYTRILNSKTTKCGDIGCALKSA
ncbi:hypothetical protein CK203_047529 [Vitis vinifera]|uniref:Uncharacterized protein n=1 Tax=Vitis vinifera TaxID=29760 RepID=A0A438GX27_VITVI|nr:hypothetical protein CK203_047529 [Vitis vinifera]